MGTTMTDAEFVTDVRKRVDYLYPKLGLIRDLKSDSDAGTVAKVEVFAFIVILKGILDGVTAD